MPKRSKVYKKEGLILIIFVLSLSLLINFVYALEPCQSGGLSTSMHKNYQMLYQDEDFIQINDLDLLMDVSQLKDLACLQYLDATDRTIKGDIANLKDLKNLVVFSLYSNPEVYGDICSLAGATNLKSLKFAFDPKITGDISCLKGLTKLETFAMTHTQITGDLSVFANMPNLKAIYVSGTNIKGNICALSNLTNLEELGIADEYPGNPEIYGDLACLDNLQKLKRVSIYNTKTINCEQFTKSHPNIAQMGMTESGRPAGGGCSKESLKTLVDVAQKYEKKIGKEVQTEVKGKPNYQPAASEEGVDNKEFDNKEFDNRNVFTKIFDWIKSLFKKEPAPPLDISKPFPEIKDDKEEDLPSKVPDGGPPKECTINGQFIGKDKCKAMMEKLFINAPDDDIPEECVVEGEFIGEAQCKTMMEVSSPQS
ncbi:MAG TPA: hypothetical protein VJA23_02740 [Candidatus Nanoarchaeia archaeon]|nr:hypothetical protein [Candidatus Nanoarchaeia archaeon]